MSPPGNERMGTDSDRREKMGPGTDDPIRSGRTGGTRKNPGPQAEEETEFQKYVYSSTGIHLPIYGSALFQNVPSTFAPLDQIAVPAGYTIGPGDELLIHAWGQIDLNARLVVDRNGQIYLPKVGAIDVAGVRFDQLNGSLTTSISRVFKNFELNVNLGQLRSMQIFVVGQACRPGTYTVSSLSTLVNALFASGGPAAYGSMRHIQLKRQDGIVSEFDFYDLLVKGDKSKDVALLPGDVIYIPPVGRLVAVTGSVNFPAIYEIREGSSVGEQISVAGGLSATADGTRAILERIDERSSRRVEEFALDSDGLSRGLQGGDVLRIFAVSPRFENAVTLRGNVARPGRYPWRAGMRIRDLIPEREALITREYWIRQNSLAPATMGWTGGSVKGRAAELDRAAAEKTDVTGPSSSAPEQVGRNSAEINWDYAMVQRLDAGDLSSRLLPFNLGRAIADAAATDNLPLEAGDVVTIFSQKDLAVPFDKRTKVVWIEGEVNAPGAYRASQGETLRDLVARAGGLTARAYLFASDFRRESTRAGQQKQMDKMADEMDAEIRSRAATFATKVSDEERMAAQEQVAAQRSLLERLRQTPATGRIVLELQPSDAQESALPTLALEDGDRLLIPGRPDTVEVVGNVYNQNSFIFKSGRSVRDYLDEAGGGTRNADPARLFVIRADGSVLSKQMHRGLWAGGFESLKLLPGDAVVMPQRIRSGSVLRGLRDWSQVFSQFALGAAAIRVISP